MFVRITASLEIEKPSALSFLKLGENIQNKPFTEKDLEEFIRSNIGILFDDDESLLIIGQQVRDTTGKRNDLVAVDGNGNLVLIELKRYRADMMHRSEPLEIQAIRYAGSLASIRTTGE